MWNTLYLTTVCAETQITNSCSANYLWHLRQSIRSQSSQKHKRNFRRVCRLNHLTPWRALQMLYKMNVQQVLLLSWFWLFFAHAAILKDTLVQLGLWYEGLRGTSKNRGGNINDITVQQRYSYNEMADWQQQPGSYRRNPSKINADLKALKITDVTTARPQLLSCSMQV